MIPISRLYVFFLTFKSRLRSKTTRTNTHNSRRQPTLDSSETNQLFRDRVIRRSPSPLAFIDLSFTLPAVKYDILPTMIRVVKKTAGKTRVVKDPPRPNKNSEGINVPNKSIFFFLENKIRF